jgi:transposase, IS5 family
VPWDIFEPEYALLFPSEEGRPALPFRVALGTLIIKEELGISDDETVLQIQENPYLQYFIGFTSYQTEVPFDGSTLVYFRKRLKWKGLSAINDLLASNAKAAMDDHKPKGGSAGRSEGTSNQKESSENNEGILKIDSTCTPADIRYPLDLSLLDEARRDTEKIIDILYEKGESIAKKPRTYRIQARQDFLAVIRKRRKSAREIRKAIGKQLRYLKRNLMHIKEMVVTSSSIVEPYRTGGDRELLTSEKAVIGMLHTD